MTAAVERAEVLVVGAGVAGCAAAIRLAQRGADVLLLSRPGARPASSQTLSPAAGPILRQLGAWDAFAGSAPLRCDASASAWQEPRLRFHDFIRDPHGQAWHVDPAAMESLLLRQAQALGVRWRQWTRPASLQRDPGSGTWLLHVDEEQLTFHGTLLVDATGRGSWASRRAGARRTRRDRQVAMAAVCGAATDGAALVEAVEDGWWYSAPASGGLYCAYFTDIDTLPGTRAGLRDHWHRLLRATTFTRGRVQAALPAQGLRMLDASGSRLACFAGADWLSCGDAAFSFDPIAAHGLTVALASGRDAGDAVAQRRTGDAQALERYAATLEHAWTHYETRRSHLYRSQPRWRASAFWQRRVMALARAPTVT